MCIFPRKGPPCIRNQLAAIPGRIWYFLLTYHGHLGKCAPISPKQKLPQGLHWIFEKEQAETSGNPALKIGKLSQLLACQFFCSKKQLYLNPLNPFNYFPYKQVLSWMRPFLYLECGLAEALACSRTETVLQEPGVICMRDLEDIQFMGCFPFSKHVIRTEESLQIISASGEKQADTISGTAWG